MPPQRISQPVLSMHALDHLPFSTIVVELDGKITYFNESFRALTGLSARKIQGQCIESILTPRCSAKTLIEQAHESGSHEMGNELRLAVNGQPVHLTLRVIPLHPSEPPRFLIAIQDQSIERQLHSKYRQKLVEIRSKTSELINVAKLAGIGELSAGLVHDIKNPLTTINGVFMQMTAALSKNRFDEKKFEKYLRMGTKATQSVIKMANQITHFARAEPKKEFHHLDELVRNAQILVDNKIRMKSVHVQVKTETDFPRIYVDGIQFEQILMNLIGNACDAMKRPSDNEVNVIEVSGLLQGDQLIIRVSDNGRGIPKDTITNIFDSLYTTKKDGEGTGLGLSIVRSIVKEHNGSVVVESELDVGTTFELRLPYVKEDSLPDYMPVAS